MNITKLLGMVLICASLLRAQPRGGVFPGGATGSGNVTAASNITANYSVIGDNGAKGIKVGPAIAEAATVSTIVKRDSAGVITATGFSSTPAGGLGGYAAFPQGTVNTPGANSVGFQAPTSVPTAYLVTLPAAPAAGFVKRTAANPSVESVAAISAADLPATPVITPGTTPTLVAPRGYAVCTGTCTVTVPVPAAGYEFCILNDNNVATAITLSALGSSAMYENSDRTAYGTAGTGTLVVAAAANKVCILGRDSTHYLTVSYNGTVTVN